MELFYHAVTLMCLAALSCAAPYETPKKPCCGPDQWTGLVVTIDTGANESYSVQAVPTMTHVAMDFRNKQFAANFTINYPYANRETHGAILDYEKKMGYFIDWDGEPKCTLLTEHDLEVIWTFLTPFECVPKNATHLGSSQLGMAPDGLNVDIWEYTSEYYFGATAHFVSAVQSDKCVPAIRYMEDWYEGTILLTRQSTFFEMQTSIRDPSVFTPPSFCPSPRAPIRLGFPFPGPAQHVPGKGRDEVLKMVKNIKL